MGTGKTGVYLNTIGATKYSLSDYALVHSNEGTFTKPSKPGVEIRLASGGHGQDGMDLLDKYGIDYKVNYTYPNGVRIGDVPDHKEKLKTSNSNQTWFPKDWTDKKIKRAGEYVMKLKKNQNAPDGKVLTGIYDGVQIGVIKTKGVPATVFPDKDQSRALRRKKKNGI